MFMKMEARIIEASVPGRLLLARPITKKRRPLNTCIRKRRQVIFYKDNHRKQWLGLRPEKEVF